MSGSSFVVVYSAMTAILQPRNTLRCCISWMGVKERSTSYCRRYRVRCGHPAGGGSRPLARGLKAINQSHQVCSMDPSVRKVSTVKVQQLADASMEN